VSLAAAILWADLRSIWNAVRHSDRRTAFVIVAALLSVPVLALAFGIGAVFGLQASHQAAPSVLAGLFVAGAMMTFLLGLSTVITSFFAQRELLLLAVAPVSPGTIFLARLARSMTTNGAMGLLLLSMVMGYGVVQSASLVYLLLTPTLIAALVLTITAFQVGLLSVVLRMVPTTRARDVANVVAAVVGTVLYVAWYSFLSGRFGGPLIGQIRAGTGAVASLNERLFWLPATWPAHALGEVAQRQLGSGLVWALATLLLALLVLAVGYLAYRQAWITGIGAFSEGAGRGLLRTIRGTPVAGVRSGGVARRASASRALARKDWLVMRRDTRRLARLLPALAMAFVYPFIFFTSAQAGVLAALAVPAFSSFFLAQVIGGPSVPSEGRVIELLSMSPLSAWRLLRAKLLFALPPVVVLCLAAALPITALRGATPLQLGLVALMTVWYASGMTALAVCMGAIDPRFGAADPNRAIGFVGIVVGLIGEAIFTVLTAGVVALVIVALYVAPAVAGAALAGAVVLIAGAAAEVAGFLVFAEGRLRAWQPG